MKLYHGTSAKVATIAIKEGLSPRSSHGKSNWKHSVESNPEMVYLTDTYAPYFALWSVKEWTKSKLGIVEIDTDFLEESLLMPDEDFIEQATREDKTNKLNIKGKTIHERTKFIRNHLERYQPNWELSVNRMGNCCYMGTIPAEAITRVVEIEPQKCKVMCLQAANPTITMANFSYCGIHYKTLLKWFMGWPVSLEEWLKADITNGAGFDLLPPNVQQQMRKKIETALKSQSSAVKILKKTV